MSKLKYSLKTDEKTTARSCGSNLRISRKDSILIGRVLKGKHVKEAETILDGVVSLKKRIPFKDIPASCIKINTVRGKYPVNAAGEILKLVKNVENNAESKGLETDKIVIKTFEAKTGRSFFRGRSAHGRRKSKSTNISIVVDEKND